MVVGNEGQELALEIENAVDRELVEVTADTAVDDGDHLLHGERLVLGLLEQLGEAGTAVEEELSRGIEIRAKLGERSDLTVLGELELERGSDLLHGAGLGSRADTRHGETDVNGGADTLEEEIGLKENLTVGNRNHVGGNVRRHVTGLGLNDGEGSHGAALVLVAELGSALEETRVKVEHITGVGLTTRGTTQKERHLAVGDGLLGQIVVDDERVLAVVTEVLTHGGTRVGRKELKGSGLRGGGGHNNGVLEGIVLLKGADELGDSRALLADGDVDAEELLLVVSGAVVDLLLVENGVKSNGGLASLTITNDQLEREKGKRVSNAETTTGKNQVPHAGHGQSGPSSQ